MGFTEVSVVATQCGMPVSSELTHPPPCFHTLYFMRRVVILNYFATHIIVTTWFSHWWSYPPLSVPPIIDILLSSCFRIFIIYCVCMWDMWTQVHMCKHACIEVREQFSTVCLFLLPQSSQGIKLRTSGFAASAFAKPSGQFSCYFHLVLSPSVSWGPDSTPQPPSRCLSRWGLMLKTK